MPRDVKPFLVLSNHPYLKTAGSCDPRRARVSDEI
jgi:hypothetical protein